MDDLELKLHIHEHRVFFDNLVELIPPNIYITNDDDPQTRHYGMSKAEQAAARQTSKERSKKAKRDRLDPEKFKSTLDLLQQRAKAPLKSENENDEEIANGNAQGQESRVATYGELRERLQQRMELLRAKRNAAAAAANAKKAQSWKNEKTKNSQKRKRVGLVASTGGVIPVAKWPKHAPSEVENDSLEKKSGLESVNTFEFGRVKMGQHKDFKSRMKKTRKESKEQLLAKATKLKSEMQDPVIGQDVSIKHSWSAALARSSGEKVYDDADLLKESLKREKQHRQKRSKIWKDRKETLRQSVDAKQRSRQEHIKERIQQKKEKKIAKREKKLLRPGFEGRREKFINE